MELKPCPFCGGKAETVTNQYFWAVRCRSCGTENGSYPRAGDAVEAWNTRAERTCRIRGGECDQCGAIIHEHANLYWVPVGEGMRTVEHRDIHYCPNCGAKVVG